MGELLRQCQRLLWLCLGEAQPEGAGESLAFLCVQMVRVLVARNLAEQQKGRWNEKTEEIVSGSLHCCRKREAFLQSNYPY